jgi:hypothetical protein
MAYHIHEWIYETLRLEEDSVSMVQVDGPNRRVYIKSVNEQRMHNMLDNTDSIQEFRHDNGEVSRVHIKMAGMGKRRIRVANLPPEVPDHNLRAVLEKFGDIKEIQEDQWAKSYRYRVSNGVRIVSMGLKHHIL